MIELLAEILILTEYWTPKTVVNKPSEFNIHRKVESKPKAINIPCLTNSNSKITGAGSLNIRTCKNYWELVSTNFELKCLLKFLDFWKQIRKKETSDLDKRKKIPKITQVGRKISIQEKKWNESVLVVLAQIFSIIGAYFIPILVLKFQLKISVKKVPKLEVCWVFFLFFYSTLEPF